MEEDAWNEDGGDEDEETTIPCPHCGGQIHEQSQRCPYCGDYISAEDAAPARKPRWIILGALLVFYIVYRWIAG